MKQCLLFALVLLAAGASAAFAGQVPDTGQATCYGLRGAIACPESGDLFFGQDAQHRTAERSFVKLDGQGRELPDAAPYWSMVRDRVTGLVWELKVGKNGLADYDNPHDADNRYSWYDDNASRNGGDPGSEGGGRTTADFVASLNSASFGGFTDWRLPTARELVWLLDRRAGGPPYIDPAYFPAAASEYWSATTDPSGSSRCATVTLEIGMMNYPAKTDSYAAMAVRGTSQLQQFRDNGDGTVSDLATGLMWQKDSVQGISWKDGLAYCGELQLGGYADWRLPDVNELISLVDYAQASPAIDDRFFINTSLHYWSSTTYPADPRKAYHVCFLRGRAEVYGKSDQGAASHLRAVRGIVAGNSSTTTTITGSICMVEELYGPNESQTRLLRRFRDEVLAPSATGRLVIAWYSRLSPVVTRCMAAQSCRTVVRAVCDGIIALLGRSFEVFDSPAQPTKKSQPGSSPYRRTK
jgi:hypothetical protein